MSRSLTSVALFGLLGLASAACPFADPGALHARQDEGEDILASYKIDDSKGYFTDDVGGQIAEQDSLRAGSRGPTLLEDFIFRQKITHFDHERVREATQYFRATLAVYLSPESEPADHAVGT